MVLPGITKAAKAFLESLPPSTRMSADARRKKEYLLETIERHRECVLALVLRDFDMAGHGSAKEGELVLVSPESFEYLRRWNIEEPLVREVVTNGNLNFGYARTD